MNYAALQSELTSDPLARGYSGMTDIEASDSLNTVNRTMQKASMTGSEVLNAINIGEWNALSDADQQKIWNVVHLGDVDPFGIEATIFTGVFGASATITALQAERLNSVSRARELTLGMVKIGDVEIARAQ